MSDFRDPFVELFRGSMDPDSALAPAVPPAPAAAGVPGAPRARWAVAVKHLVLVFIGFVLIVAYQQMVDDGPSTQRARADLLTDVRQRQADADRLQRTADALRVSVSQRRGAADDRPDAASRSTVAAAGFGPVKGPGAVVRLTDAPPPVDPVTGKPTADNPGLVLDRDLQDIVNALWRLGAEAIAVDGRRLTSTTTIRAAGGTILVDYRPVTSPYEVAAIGGEDLADRFQRSAIAHRFRQYSQVYRMGIKVSARGSLTLPATSQPRLRYAVPAPAAPGGSD